MAPRITVDSSNVQNASTYGAARSGDVYSNNVYSSSYIDTATPSAAGFSAALHAFQAFDKNTSAVTPLGYIGVAATKSALDVVTLPIIELGVNDGTVGDDILLELSSALTTLSSGSAGLSSTMKTETLDTSSVFTVNNAVNSNAGKLLLKDIRAVTQDGTTLSVFNPSGTGTAAIALTTANTTLTCSGTQAMVAPVSTLDSTTSFTLSGPIITLKGTASADTAVGVTGNMTVSGNLTINGTTTTINTDTITVEDKSIRLASNTAPAAHYASFDNSGVKVGLIGSVDAGDTGDDSGIFKFDIDTSHVVAPSASVDTNVRDVYWRANVPVEIQNDTSGATGSNYTALLKESVLTIQDDAATANIGTVSPTTVSVVNGTTSSTINKTTLTITDTSTTVDKSAVLGSTSLALSDDNSYVNTVAAASIGLALTGNTSSALLNYHSLGVSLVDGTTPANNKSVTLDLANTRLAVVNNTDTSHQTPSNLTYLNSDTSSANYGLSSFDLTNADATQTLVGAVNSIALANTTAGYSSTWEDSLFNIVNGTTSTLALGAAQSSIVTSNYTQTSRAAYMTLANSTNHQTSKLEPEQLTFSDSDNASETNVLTKAGFTVTGTDGLKKTMISPDSLTLTNGTDTFTLDHSGTSAETVIIKSSTDVSYFKVSFDGTELTFNYNTGVLNALDVAKFSVTV